jgi:hypothetical protein
MDSHQPPTMTNFSATGLVELSDVTPATMPVAVLSKEPEELATKQSIQFSEGFDDLDYVMFSDILLPSGYRATLVRHRNSPNSGIEICTKPDEPNIPEVLIDVLQALSLSNHDLKWIHPEYEQAIRTTVLSSSSLLKN